MSEHDEKMMGQEEEPVLEDEPKEAVREAVEEGYKPPPSSESIEQEAEEHEEEWEEAEVEEEPEEEILALDLNTATAKELSSLPGIGSTLAGRIVSYREEEGSFREAVEITNVRGISQAMYEAIADQITVGLVEMEGIEGVEEEEGEAYVAPLVTEEEEAAEAVLPPPVERFHPVEPPRARGGVGWGSLLVVGLLSTLAGALLALLILFLLNGGTLDFERATTRAIDREMSQVEGQLGEVRTDLEQVRQRLGELGELSLRLDEAEAEIGAVGGAVESLRSELALTSEGLGDVRRTLAGLSDDLISVAESVTALEGQVAEMDEQLTGVDKQLAKVDEQLVALRKVTARFDTFLVGLRELLEGSVPEPVTPRPSGPKSTPTPTPWITPTPAPAGPSPTPASKVTVIPLASPTP